MIQKNWKGEFFIGCPSDLTLNYNKQNSIVTPKVHRILWVEQTKIGKIDAHGQFHQHFMSAFAQVSLHLKSSNLKYKHKKASCITRA